MSYEGYAINQKYAPEKQITETLAIGQTLSRLEGVGSLITEKILVDGRWKNASLLGATFQGVQFLRHLFEGGDLSHSRFLGCILQAAVFDSIQLNNVLFRDCYFKSLRLIEGLALETIQFENCVFEEAIPPVLLRNCKLVDCKTIDPPLKPEPSKELLSETKPLNEIPNPPPVSRARPGRFSGIELD